MKLIAIVPFSWAHRGVHVEHFEEGVEIETEDQDLIEVSTREGWTKCEGDAHAAAEDEQPGSGGPVEPVQPSEVPPPGTDETPAPKPGRKTKAKE